MRARKSPRIVALKLFKTKCKFPLIFLAAVNLCGCQAALFGALGTLGGSAVQVRRDVVFDAAHHLALDVYRPARPALAPIVVFFYGGSWRDGKRSWYRYVGQALASRGVVVVVPDYRKYPQVVFPAFVQDAARAVAWAHANAASIGGDPRQLFVMGHSAGAHIGAMLATDARYLDHEGMKPRDLSGFIGLAGPYDFAPFTDPELVAIFGSSPDSQRAAQPINFVDGNEPPMLLLQGLTDKKVLPRNSPNLAARMQAAGETAQCKFYPDVGHTKIALSLAPAFSRWSSALNDTLEFITAQTRLSPDHQIQTDGLE